MSGKTSKTSFIEPMRLVPTQNLPDDPTRWTYELKLDGYRAIGFTTGGQVRLRSRNDNDFAARYPAVAAALRALPDETVVDGEIVALDSAGRPSFNALQNSAQGAAVHYYLFDVMILGGRDVMRKPLSVRRELLETRVLPGLADPIRLSPLLNGTMADLIGSIRSLGLEGLVAKRRDSAHEPGQRSGAWQKMRLNRAQDFVIGGYTVGGRIFDALVFGYYGGGRLLYAARTRNGFTPALREQVFAKFRGLATPACPFANLPEAKAGRWGEGLTSEKMKDCRWLRPELVGRVEFVEWTPDNHLRHSRFVALREDRSRVERRES